MDIILNRGNSGGAIVKIGKTVNDDEVIGTIALVNFNNHQAALRKMFVKKNFRGKEFGVGQKLFDTLLKWSQEKNIDAIYLGTLAHMYAAHNFYRRNGFVEIQKTGLSVLEK